MLWESFEARDTLVRELGVRRPRSTASYRQPERTTAGRVKATTLAYIERDHCVDLGLRLRYVAPQYA